MVRKEIDQESRNRIANVLKEVKKWPEEDQMHLIEEIFNSKAFKTPDVENG